MEPTNTVVAWLGLGCTVLFFFCTALGGYVAKVKADAQREADKLNIEIARHANRVSEIEDQVTAWQLETLRQHPTKQDLRDLEIRLVERMTVIVNGARSG